MLDYYQANIPYEGYIVSSQCDLKKKINIVFAADFTCFTFFKQGKLARCSLLALSKSVFAHNTCNN